MITDKFKFFLGLTLLALFCMVMVALFSPIFGGQNALQYLDALYNSISKGSAYYIPSVREEVALLPEAPIQVTVCLNNPQRAEQVAALYNRAGTDAVAMETNVVFNGDLKTLLGGCLEDADLLYNNRGAILKEKYGYDERQVMFDWWESFKSLEKALTAQELFKETKILALVQEKVVEPSYNYYGVEPQKIKDRLGVVLFSLVFYVIYTIWYGYAIMYICEGWGLSLSH